MFSFFLFVRDVISIFKPTDSDENETQTEITDEWTTACACVYYELVKGKSIKSGSMRLPLSTFDGMTSRNYVTWDSWAGLGWVVSLAD